MSGAILGDLLADLALHFRRFVVLTEAQQIAIALWTAHTYVYEQGDTTPYMVVTSAEKGSGKTRLFEALRPIVCRSLYIAGTLTEAALFRVIAERSPTLLIDETDAIFKTKHDLSERQEALRGILNAGYRKGACVIRVNATQGGKIEDFPVFGPKAMAGIGELPDTIADRGLAIRLERRTESEIIESGRLRILDTTGAALAARLAEWALTCRIDLNGNAPKMSPLLDDRAQDAYEILMGIALLASDPWPEQASKALVELRHSTHGDRDSSGLLLLRDLKGCLAHFPEDLIATADVLQALYSYGEQPWAEWWNKGKAEPDTSSKGAARQLANRLKPYGVAPGQWRDGAQRSRGYLRTDFEAVVARYCGDT